MAITRLQILDLFDIKSEQVAAVDSLLSKLPHNMRVGKDRYTLGTVKRMVGDGYIVRPNWVSQNKATCRAILEGTRYTVSQSGVLSKSPNDSGIALQAYCIKNSLVMCDSWKIKDNVTDGDILVVAYCQGADSVTVLTTAGYRTMSQEGALL